MSTNVKAVMENIQAEEPPKRGVEALSILFTDLESPLLRYAIKLVEKREIAEDLVQDAFIRLHAHYDKVKNHRSWLYRTVHNLAMDHHRASKKIISIDAEAEEKGTEMVLSVGIC